MGAEARDVHNRRRGKSPDVTDVFWMVNALLRLICCNACSKVAIM